MLLNITRFYKCHPLLLSCCLLAACGGGSSDGGKNKPVDITPPVANENVAPVVEAGEEIKARGQTTIQLIGLAHDADGTISSVLWRQVSGLPVTIATPESLTTEVNLPQVVYPHIVALALEVRDNDGATSEDIVIIEIRPENTAPIAVAGESLTVAIDQDFSLDASQSEDVDGTISSYEWFLDEVRVSTDKVYSHSHSLPGSYTYTLQVTDNAGAIATDDVTVTITQLTSPEFRSSFTLDLQANTPSATAQSCEDFISVKSDVSSSAALLASYEQNLTTREQERAEINEQKGLLNELLALLRTEIADMLQTKDSLEEDLAQLEQQTDTHRETYETCREESGSEACADEYSAYQDSRSARNLKRQELSEIEIALFEKKDEEKKAEGDLDEVIEQQIDNEIFFAQYDDTQNDLEFSYSILMAYAGLSATFFEAKISGTVQETPKAKLNHARMVYASARESLGGLQTPGITQVLTSKSLPAGGNNSYSWSDIWQTDELGNPTSAGQLNLFFAPNPTIHFSIDMPQYCIAGFTDSDESKFELNNIYMELFVSHEKEINNQYKVSINPLDTLTALSARTNGDRFLSRSKLQQISSENIEGFNSLVVSEIDDAESEAVKDALKKDYLNRLLSTYAVPVVRSDMQTDCGDNSADWCAYHGWWLLSPDSPINKGMLTDNAIDEYIVSGTLRASEVIFEAVALE